MLSSIAYDPSFQLTCRFLRNDLGKGLGNISITAEPFAIEPGGV